MTRLSRITFYFLLSTFYFLLSPFHFSPSACAQGVIVTDDDVNAVAKKLTCPVCENIPLDVCDTPACLQWRELIRHKLAAGETPEQIIAYFHETYGDRVLREPPRRGLTTLLWILPVVGVVAGVLILGWALRSMSAAPSSGPAPAPANGAQDEYRKRLERDLANGEL